VSGSTRFKSRSRGWRAMLASARETLGEARARADAAEARIAASDALR